MVRATFHFKPACSTSAFRRSFKRSRRSSRATILPATCSSLSISAGPWRGFPLVRSPAARRARTLARSGPERLRDQLHHPKAIRHQKAIVIATNGSIINSSAGSTAPRDQRLRGIDSSAGLTAPRDRQLRGGRLNGFARPASDLHHFVEHSRLQADARRQEFLAELRPDAGSGETSQDAPVLAYPQLFENKDVLQRYRVPLDPAYLLHTDYPR